GGGGRARFVDPGVARDQHDLPFAPPGEALAFQQKIELVLAADEIGQTRRADRLEATLGIGYALDHPRCDRLGNRSPSKRRVEAATTMVPGSAKACRRAARFGVSPTTACSLNAPSR